MARLDEQLYSFMTEHTADMTEEWLRKIHTSGRGVYAAGATSEAYQQLRIMNAKLNQAVTSIFLGRNADLTEWAGTIGSVRSRSDTPLFDFVKNLSIFKSVYFSHLERFITENEEYISALEALKWGRAAGAKFDEASELVTQTYISDYEKIMKSQQATIVELETPVISIGENLGVIPLVGEIDTHRASYIASFGLQRASELELEYIVLDLSGVPIIDTMVANELFQMYDSFKLLGIEMVLTGMRPEIAMTSINLGLKFSKVRTFAHLRQAISYIQRKEES